MNRIMVALGEGHMRMGHRACYADTKRHSAILDHYHDAGAGRLIHTEGEIKTVKGVQAPR